MQATKKILKVSFGGDLRRIALNSTNFETLEQQIVGLFSIGKGDFSIKYKDDEGDLISLCSTEELIEAINCSKDNILRLTISEKKRECKRERRRRSCRSGGFGKWKSFQSQKEQEKQEKQEKEEEKNGEQEGREYGRWNQHHSHRNYLNGYRKYYPQKQKQDQEQKQFQGQEQLQEQFQGQSQFNIIEMIAPIATQLIDEKEFESIVEKLFQNEHETKRRHDALCDKCDQTIFGIRWKCFECDDFDLCNSCFLESNGKEEIKTHSKDHSFGKIEEPFQIYSFSEIKKSFNEQKVENQILKIQNEKQKQENVVCELEMKRKFIQEKLEEERVKFMELQSQISKQEEQEKVEEPKQQVVEKQKEKVEEPKQQVVEQEQKQEVVKKQKEEVEEVEEQREMLKIVYPFEQKLEALESMGFVECERNIKLLLKHKGELLPVVQDLLN